MQVTVKELMASPRAWLKLWNCQTDRYHLLFTALRCGVLLGIAALLQGVYFNMSIPTEDGMESTRARTELVRTIDPRIFTLQVKVGNHNLPIRGACTGYHHGESNLASGQDVRIWQEHGKIWQITTLAGEVYRPAADAMPCSLTNSLEWAERRPELAGWLALFGALVALTAMWRVTALYERDRHTAQAGTGSEV